MVKWYIPLIGAGTSGKTFTINEFYRLCLKEYRNIEANIKITSEKKRLVEMVVNNRVVYCYLVPYSYQERYNGWIEIKKNMKKDIEHAKNEEYDIIVAAFNPKGNLIIDSTKFANQESLKIVPIYLRRHDGTNIGALDKTFGSIRTTHKDTRIIDSRKDRETEQAEKLEAIIQRYCKHDI